MPRIAPGYVIVSEMSKNERNWRPTLMALADIKFDLRVGATKGDANPWRDQRAA
jgi:hypothetical protein